MTEDQSMLLSLLLAITLGVLSAQALVDECPEPGPVMLAGVDR
jgi:hypothetical protein